VCCLAGGGGKGESYRIGGKVPGPQKMRQFGTQAGGIGMGITGGLMLGGPPGKLSPATIGGTSITGDGSITGVTTCDMGTLTLTGWTVIRGVEITGGSTVTGPTPAIVVV